MQPEHSESSKLVRVGSAANEIEAALVAQALQEEGLTVTTDISPGSTLFGGLPFEPGHQILVPDSQAERARLILNRFPHFKSPESAGGT